MKLEKNMVMTKTILMRFNLILTFVFSLSSFQLFCQNAYPLHPSVGDTLEQIEKLDYSLFPFIDNEPFDYGVIGFEGESFVLKIHTESANWKQKLSQEQIIEAQQNIEKINAYYRLKAEKEALEQKEKEEARYAANRPSGKEPVIFDDARTNQMKKEARMMVRLREDRLRMQNTPGNIQPNQLRFEFK